jgi:hypothetical protein
MQLNASDNRTRDEASTGLWRQASDPLVANQEPELSARFLRNLAVHLSSA